MIRGVGWTAVWSFLQATRLLVYHAEECVARSKISGERGWRERDRRWDRAYISWLSPA